MAISGTSQAPAEEKSWWSSFGDGSLFKEIGHTLEEIGTEYLQNSATQLRTTVARRLAPEGTVIAGGSIQSYLPIIIIAIVAFVLFKKFVKV
jgi:hypothetical protein